MRAAITSEFRKLLTIRSTYAIIAFCVAITVFFAFYLQGYALKSDVTDSGMLAAVAASAAAALGLFIALAGVLLMTHEYRYNTIMYSLTSSRNRLMVLLAKVIVVSAFAIVVTLAMSSLAALLSYLGVQARGLDIVPQSIPYADLAWRAAFYGWCYSMFALLLATIIRNQVGTFAVLFLFPSLGESLLGLLLKANAKYLPFQALGGILQAPGVPPGSLLQSLTPVRAALILLAYIVVGWAVAAVLFQRRDAN